MRETTPATEYCKAGPEVGRYSPKMINRPKPPNFSFADNKKDKERYNRDTYLFLFANKPNERVCFDNDFGYRDFDKIGYQEILREKNHFETVQHSC